MPPQRTNRRSRSRSQSLAAAPRRPDSSHSTSSLRSAVVDAQTSYSTSQQQQPPPPPSTTSQPSTDAQISALEHAHLARMLQAENVQLSQSSMDSQIADASRRMPVTNAPSVQPHMPQTFYQQTSMHGYPPATMEYAYAVPHGLPVVAPQPVYAEQQVAHIEVEARRPRLSTGQTNENELRDMLDRNMARSLDEVADDVVANERTSSAEKSKQLFAMLWLKQNLVQSKTSVPRIRVHTQYAARCARHHLQPLNQASFGKLVRVLFPDIQTRRLGVRGESKYHYVDLSLVDDVTEVNAEPFRRQSGANFGPTAVKRGSLNLDSIPRFEPDSAVIPSEQASPTLASSTVAKVVTPDAEVRVFPAPQDPKYDSQGPTSARSYRQKMKFSSVPIMRGNDTDEINLPNIYDFAPVKWDKDIKDALQTTYYSHVISIIDHVRYCKEKAFFRTITAFQGTMTVPVQKLFFHEDIARWVRACDFLMYQKIIRFLAPLTLQVMPPKVMKFLHSVSKLLYSHITNTFGGIPRHTLDAKLEPATLFCQLLERLIRTNQTAHAAGVALIEDTNRQRMWAEYVELVQPKSMMSAFIPDCGYDEDVYKLLTYDLRNLLLPLSTDISLELNTHYQFAAEIQNSLPQPTTFELDKIGSFLESLKMRFPTVPSRDLLHFIQGVTSYVLRDITMENGQSYTGWLLTKCFIDELALWLVHAGGFLEHNPLSRVPHINAPANGATGISNGTNGTPNDAASGSQSRQDSASDVEVNNMLGDSLPLASNSTVGGTQDSNGQASGQNPTMTQDPFGLMDMKHTDLTDSPMLDRSEMSPSKEIEMDDSGIGLSLTYESPNTSKSMLDMQQQQSPSKEIEMITTTTTNDVETH